MADIIVTAANVRPDTTKPLVRGTAGEAITAGQLCALNASNLWVKYDSNLVGVSSLLVLAIAMNNAPSANQPIDLQSADGASVNLGATLVVGTIYAASETAGGIAPVADLVTGETVSIVGVATTSALITLAIRNFAVAVP
mgnify:CR=1 FL=1